jgi:tRNA pseudouridine65 synthase
MRMVPESTGRVQITYRDDDIIVIDKPPGMLTHSNTFDRHSPNVLMVAGSMVGQAVYTVHRLDRMTTGVMVLALHRAAAADLSLQFRERTTEKRYLALVRGHPDDEGTISTPMPRNVRGEEVEASTSYRTLGRGVVHEPVGRYDVAWLSLVELTLHTGRSHQARRHLHQINHPVLGDNKHGDKTYNRWAAARMGERYMYLRASELTFTHPSSGERLTFTGELPTIWRRALKAFAVPVPDR